MSYYRFKIAGSAQNSKFTILEDNDVSGKNKQELFKQLKQKYKSSRIYIRKNSVICVE
uniref:Uncharacterized protein n=1 Tax=viral metagenome TaxID=1070528 RepID=A0A6C0L2L2_9ZZZZ|tara:strand:+ start:2087 stop:2260 length:174 start_codon:yes stop_codon:yes gene_type:complete